MIEPSSVGMEPNGVVSYTSPPQHLVERLKDYGQEDAFALWDELSPQERDLLVKDIEVKSAISFRSLDLSDSDMLTVTSQRLTLEIVVLWGIPPLTA